METSTIKVRERGQEQARRHLKTPLQTERNKNQFLATLAHELRNPLAPILNGLQLLSLMGLGDEAEELCAMMARQVNQIVHLVDDLSDIARIDEGKLHLDKQICKLSTVIVSAIEEASILIHENKMSLAVIDESHAACICCDPNRITQVICNLLNNSAKYGKAGGKVSVHLAARNGSAMISIKDDGIGIEAGRLEDIFNMYFQIDNAHSSGSAGLGIGLALVRNLVELHGGFVKAESDGLNCGSTFTISLPLVTGVDWEASQLVSAPHSSRSYRVLVVDDLRAMRVVTKQLLEKLGHEVQVAENGEDALKKLGSFRPDIVLADISMPVMGGLELARRVRERPDMNQACLVALTGYGQASDRELVFEAGFDHHLTKPLELDRLRDLFKELDCSEQKFSDHVSFEPGGFQQAFPDALLIPGTFSQI